MLSSVKMTSVIHDPSSPLERFLPERAFCIVVATSVGLFAVEAAAWSPLDAMRDLLELTCYLMSG